MLRVRSVIAFILLVWSFFCHGTDANHGFGPTFPATKGEVWPAPQHVKMFGEYYYTVVMSKLNFVVEHYQCDILHEAIQRYKRVIAVQHGPARFLRFEHAKPYTTKKYTHTDKYKGSIENFYIILNQPCEERPHAGMNELYELKIDSESPLAVLISDSIWGILRGLETFSQTLYRPSFDSNVLWVNATWIQDFPRYKYRGLMIDTSRHYLTMNTLLTAIDAMAYNKLNVFHWHIVDDQSFPYQSTMFPSLSDKGAYHPVAMIYSKKDIQKLVEYARLRGIRVIVEFDIPGHTRSWGEAYPHLLTPCFKDGKVEDLGPMDPTKETTYLFLEQILTEATQIFPDAAFHFGGDEVDESCWASNPDIQDFMKEHKMNTTHELHAMFMKRVLELKLPRSITPIVWQEVFDNGVPMPNNSLVQIWKDETSSEITKVTQAGYNILYSSCWYLSVLATGGDWDNFYNCDPASLLSEPALRDLIYGGEACMWGEYVDNHNILTRMFPRACAVAERLWSSSAVNSTSHAAYRLEEHACRMSQRGVETQPPNGPGFCL